MKVTQTILLVDDCKNDVNLMRIAFKKAAWEVFLVEVHNGEEAIAYLNGENAFADRVANPFPSLLLLDLNMPRKNGFELLAWLRAQSPLKRCSVIILTASMRSLDVEQAFQLGAHAFLVKPSTIDELILILRRLRDWLEINQFPPL